jgi:dTDP-4-dehydrorhamnose 3,5-epimerase
MNPAVDNELRAFTKGIIDGVIVTRISKFVDERGWLAEFFRNDELGEEFHPAMGYISATQPGMTRGPHEHVDQADLFTFIGPSNFKLRLWDVRPQSPSLGKVMTLFVGEDNPSTVLIPKGIVHAYRNIGQTSGIVINCPNRLYKGEHKQDEIDEIRHEDDPDTPFVMD